MALVSKSKTPANNRQEEDEWAGLVPFYFLAVAPQALVFESHYIGTDRADRTLRAAYDIETLTGIPAKMIPESKPTPELKFIGSSCRISFTGPTGREMPFHEDFPCSN